MSLPYRLPLLALLGLLLTWAVTPLARAVDADDLLPVDEAFVLSAQPGPGGRIDIRWQIADGYYLYRHRTEVRALSGLEGGSLRLPAGKPHVDEFFGPVETYRTRLDGVFEGGQASSAGPVTLQIKYQGCADAGICYPPQTRELKVALPAGGNPLAALPGATGTSPSAAGNPLRGLLQGQAALPEQQAFSVDAIADGGNRLLVRLQPAPGYYIYRDRSAFALEGLDGVQTGKPRWPTGTRHRDEHFGEVVVYFEPIEAVVPLLREHTRAGKATLVVTFQGCQDGGICYPPMTRRIRLDLPEGKPDVVANVVPRAALPAVPASDTEPTEAVPAAGAADAAATERLPAPPPADQTIAGGPDASSGNAQRTRAPEGGAAQLLGILALALLGGLALNLMPCVLPILSLKALGLAQSGESRSHARRHALWYTAGVLVAFAVVGMLVIALRAAGQAAGWGFQLQHPWFVATLVYLMFAVGLSLSGVFTLGGGLGGMGQALATRSGPAGDFFTGVLACVVASPCVAPFMGPALAYAFTASAPAAMLVLLTLGLGLALPFLLIGFVPGVAQRLPRPGAWMETLKQVLAFPMYLTAIWLLWVLGRQRGVDAIALVLAGAALLALALWWFERVRWRGRRGAALLPLALVVLALVPVWGVSRIAPPTAAATPAEGALAYSAAELDRLRAQDRVVFVNMTADWCVTCKANERNVLSGDAFHAMLARSEVVYMKGDWTNADPEISAFLEAHKAVGVPLYVIYGPGAPPTVLPPVLTSAVLEDALLRAATR